MNQRCHEEIARDAWIIYKKAQKMQESLLELFIDDFMDFEKQERNLQALQEEELPF